MTRALPLAIFLALLVSAAPPARAQQEAEQALAASTPAERAAFQTKFMQSKLALTPEQLPKVQAINLDTAQKMQPLLTSDERPLRKMRAMKAIEADKEKALQGVLTPEQFQTFLTSRDELKQKLEQHVMEKRKGAGGGS